MVCLLVVSVSRYCVIVECVRCVCWYVCFCCLLRCVFVSLLMFVCYVCCVVCCFSLRVMFVCLCVVFVGVRFCLFVLYRL